MDGKWTGNYASNFISNCPDQSEYPDSLHGKFIFMNNFVDRIKHLNGKVLSRFDKMGQLIDSFPSIIFA